MNRLKYIKRLFGDNTYVAGVFHLDDESVPVFKSSGRRDVYHADSSCMHIRDKSYVVVSTLKHERGSLFTDACNDCTVEP